MRLKYIFKRDTVKGVLTQSHPPGLPEGGNEPGVVESDTNALNSLILNASKDNNQSDDYYSLLSEFQKQHTMLILEDMWVFLGKVIPKYKKTNRQPITHRAELEWRRNAKKDIAECILARGVLPVGAAWLCMINYEQSDGIFWWYYKFNKTSSLAEMVRQFGSKSPEMIKDYGHRYESEFMDYA